VIGRRFRQARGNTTPGAPVTLPEFAQHGPARFLLHYVLRHPREHAVVLAAVLAAVGCAIGSQYGVKHLVDLLGSQDTTDGDLWSAVVLLLALVAGR
jgi:ATP-binding cassette, subfamily B, bacterial